MELADVMTHVAAAVGGGGGASVLTRFIFKGWQKRNDRIEKTLDKAVELLTRLDERVKTLQERDRSTEHAIEIAMLKERTEKHRSDLNGLGNKIRELTSDS